MVEPKWYSSRRRVEDDDANRAAFLEMAELQRSDGATFFRYTVDGEWLWVEGWPEFPRDGQAPFNPPYIAESEPEVHRE